MPARMPIHASAHMFMRVSAQKTKRSGAHEEAPHGAKVDAHAYSLSTCVQTCVRTKRRTRRKPLIARKMIEARADACLHMRIDMCMDVCAGMCIDMCMDVCTDMCIDMCTGKEACTRSP